MEKFDCRKCLLLYTKQHNFNRYEKKNSRAKNVKDQIDLYAQDIFHQIN